MVRPLLFGVLIIFLSSCVLQDRYQRQRLNSASFQEKEGQVYKQGSGFPQQTPVSEKPKQVVLQNLPHKPHLTSPSEQWANQMNSVEEFLAEKEKLMYQLESLNQRVKTLEVKLDSLQNINNAQSGSRSQKKVSLKKSSKKGQHKTKKKVSKDPITVGDQLYRKKKFIKAIEKYNSYREKYPKGKRYAYATFQIARSLEALGSKSDAKAFYEELKDKFSKTKYGQEAKKKL